jgi:TRAP-type C4-dicarboxylate transport system substrate-binding protein
MGLMHVAMVGRRSPVLEFLGSFGAQGCWESYDHYYRFLDNPEVLKIAGQEFDKYFNARLLSPWAYGTGLVGAKRPIEKVEDFKGLKMRTSGTAQAAMYKALGAIPTELSSKEIYTALQRGTIQGATSGSSRFRRSKLYEVVPYITVDVTLPYLSFWVAVNKDTWAKLSADDQKVLLETAKELQKWSRDYAARERDEDIAFLKKHTKKFIELSDSEVQKLISTVKPAMKEFSTKRLGDMHGKLWGLLEATK